MNPYQNARICYELLWFTNGVINNTEFDSNSHSRKDFRDLLRYRDIYIKESDRTLKAIGDQNNIDSKKTQAAIAYFDGNNKHANTVMATGLKVLSKMTESEFEDALEKRATKMTFAQRICDSDIPVITDDLESFKKGYTEVCVAQGYNLDMAVVEKSKFSLASVTSLLSRPISIVKDMLKI